MKGSLQHIQINVSNPKEAFPFYKGLFEYFDYKVLYEEENILGLGNGDHSVWFLKTDGEGASVPYNRDGNGLNHLAFHVDSREDVNKFYKEFMGQKNIKPEFETPRERPEMGTYYQVMFLGPDNLGLEVVYTTFGE
jgi:catechol 2,3-dioxygenase-like lactoylglutathione lyase family enzyme